MFIPGERKSNRNTREFGDSYQLLHSDENAEAVIRPHQKQHNQAGGEEGNFVTGAKKKKILRKEKTKNNIYYQFNT